MIRRAKELLCFGALMLCTSMAQAELRASYSPNLNDSFALDGARVMATEVYLFENGVNPEDIRCCEWSEGPGSAERLDGWTGTVEGSATKIDLGRYPDRSVRRAHVGSERSTFTVTHGSFRNRLTLRDSGPINVSRDGQVIENLRIRTSQRDQCAIRVTDRRNVVIRNVEIEHENIGICIVRSPDTTVLQAKITSTSAPESGPHCKFGVSNCNRDKANRANADDRLNIWVHESSNVAIEHAYLEKGGAGVMLYKSDHSRLNDLHCFDARGPYPRGNCVQWVNSDYGVLKNFYIKNIKDVSHELDNVNLYDSDYVKVSDGLLDGSFSINGVGVIADWGSDNATIERVDFTRTSVAAVNVYAGPADKVGKNFLVRDIRVRDTSCSARDGHKPSSGGLAVAVHPEAINPRIINAIYWNHCRSQAAWCVGGSCRKQPGGIFDIRKQEFELREPLTLTFAWEVGDGWREGDLDRRPTIRNVEVVD